MNLRYLWRSVSLVFVLWFALFPTLSYASETVTNQTYTYDWREAERELLEYSADSGGSTTWTIDKDDVANGLVQSTIRYSVTSPWQWKYIGNPFSWISPMDLDVFEFSTGYSSYNSLLSSEYGSYMEIHVLHNMIDNGKLIDEGESVNIKMSGLKSQMKYNYSWSWSVVNVGGGAGNGTAYYPLNYENFDNIRIELYDINNQVEYLNYYKSDIDDILVINGDTFGIDADISTPFDVYKINVVFAFKLSDYNWSIPDASSYHKNANHTGGTGIFFQTNIYNGVLKITAPDESTGLLKGIIEWLRSIRDGIVNVANYVLELPSRIWTFIQEGLKMLFIPSEQDISNMHNQWDELMRDRFGAIYESGDIVHSFADTMNVNSAMVADTGGVITMPSVTANLAGTNFTFGGYEVDLVPDGFQWLVTSIKMLINIVCTILFINALKGKIEVLLR